MAHDQQKHECARAKNNQNDGAQAPQAGGQDGDLTERVTDTITRPFLPLFRWLGLSASSAKAIVLMVQLVIVLFGAAQLPWWVGPTASVAGHEIAVGWAWFRRIGMSPPDRFTIMLARFENDPDDAHLYRLLKALHQNFNGAIPIVVEPVTFDDRWDGTRENWVLAQAQDWLGNRAHVVVWGRVWPDQSYSLRLVSSTDQADALWDTIDSRQLGLVQAADSDEVISSKIVIKALGLILNSPAPEDKKLAYLNQVVPLLMPLIQQMGDKIPLQDRVNMTIGFAQASLQVEDRQGLSNEAPAAAISAIQNLLDDPVVEKVMSPGQRLRLTTNLAEVESAGSSLQDENDAIQTLDSVVKAQAIPDGVSAFDYATAEVDYANALEVRGECETIVSPQCRGDQRSVGMRDFGVACYFYMQAIRLLRPYAIGGEGKSPLRIGLSDRKDALWTLGEADDRLGLALVKMAKLSKSFDLTWAFEILGDALGKRSAYESDLAFTLTRIGEAYQAEGGLTDDIPTLKRGIICFNQALTDLQKDAPGDFGFDLFYRDQITIYIAGLKKNPLLVDSATDPPPKWKCSPPNTQEVAELKARLSRRARVKS